MRRRCPLPSAGPNAGRALISRAEVECRRQYRARAPAFRSTTRTIGQHRVAVHRQSKPRREPRAATEPSLAAARIRRIAIAVDGRRVAAHPRDHRALESAKGATAGERPARATIEYAALAAWTRSRSRRERSDRRAPAGGAAGIGRYRSADFRDLLADPPYSRREGTASRSSIPSSGRVTAERSGLPRLGETHRAAGLTAPTPTIGQHNVRRSSSPSLRFQRAGRESADQASGGVEARWKRRRMSAAG